MQDQDAIMLSMPFPFSGPQLPEDVQGKNKVFGHVDFDIKSKEYSFLRTQEFSWGDHCFSMLNRYYPGIAELFDDGESTPASAMLPKLPLHAAEDFYSSLFFCNVVSVSVCDRVQRDQESDLRVYRK